MRQKTAVTDGERLSHENLFLSNLHLSASLIVNFVVDSPFRQSLVLIYLDFSLSIVLRPVKKTVILGERADLKSFLCHFLIAQNCLLFLRANVQ